MRHNKPEFLRTTIVVCIALVASAPGAVAAPSHPGLRNLQLRAGNPLHAGLRYDARKCTVVHDSRIATAVQVGSMMAGRGYRRFGNNCLDATHDVLQSYGAPDLPGPSLTLAATVYFNLLPWTRSDLQRARHMTTSH